MTASLRTAHVLDVDLMDHVEGRTGGVLAGVIEAHLERCDHCRWKVANLRRGLV